MRRCGRDFLGGGSLELGRIGDRRQGLAALFAGERRAQAGYPLGAQPFGQLQVADLVGQVSVRLAVKTGHELFQLGSGDPLDRRDMEQPFPDRTSNRKIVRFMRPSRQGERSRVRGSS